MPTMSAPAALASSALAPCANTATRLVLPVPLGITTAPRTTWSDFFGVDAELHGHVDRLIELGGGAFLDEREGVVERVQLGAVDLALEGFLRLGELGHVQTPSTVMPIERAEPAMVRDRGVQVGGGQVLQLGLGDLFELGAGDLADLVGVRLGRALVELDRLLDQHRRRRRLDDEGEATCPRTR